MDVYRLSGRELFEAFVGDMRPPDLLNYEREQLAARIMLDHDLTEDESAYAADQIMNFAIGWEDTEAQFDDLP